MNNRAHVVSVGSGLIDLNDVLAAFHGKRDMVATVATRPSTPEERDAMRALARKHGAGWRQPVAWGIRLLRESLSFPFYCLAWAMILPVAALPLLIVVFYLVATLAPAWWGCAQAIAAWLYAASVLIAAGVGWFSARRRKLGPMAADAFPGDKVEVWSVRGATAAHHEKGTWGGTQACPGGTGDSLYFDLPGEEVFCLSGPEWRALAQGEAEPSSLLIEGAFPATDFDVVVMPRCRKVLRIAGRGGALPLVEYDSRWEWSPRNFHFGVERRALDGGAGRRGQAGVFCPSSRPWDAPAEEGPDRPSLAGGGSAVFVTREAAPEEQAAMRERAYAGGATWRAPGAWLRRMKKDARDYLLLLCVGTALGFLAYLVIYLGLWGGSMDAVHGYWSDWKLALIPVAAAALVLMVHLRRDRSLYAPIRQDAFFPSRVEEWDVRVEGPGHLACDGWSGEFAPQDKGSRLYFDLTDGRVLCLEGADWMALTRGRSPEGMAVEGAFPSDHFSLVVAPRSRRILKVTSIGAPRPFHEWMEEYNPNAKSHEAFRRALRAVRKKKYPPWTDMVCVFHPSARPWT